MRFLTLTFLAFAIPVGAQAATITADTVLEYSEPTNDPLPTNGVFDGIPNGLETGGAEYDPVDLKIGTTGANTVVTDGNSSTYVSLPIGTFISLGFSTGFIFDGTGNDLFVDEIGAASEFADIFVSSDFGATFTYLDRANGSNTTNEFDFANYAFLPSDIKVNAVKVLGQSNGGSSPGFDLTFVRGLEGSVVIDPQVPSTVPLPAGLPLLLAGFGALALTRGRSTRRQRR